LPGFAEAHPELAEWYPMVTARFSGRNRVRRVVGEHTWLARQVAGSEIVHHGGGTVPGRPIRGSATVLTIHDLQFRSYPQYFSRIKLRY
ncbi:MAG TPA: hypothetical protein PLV68_20435, partial [Ilumatobacteraceae bacterium]|nr:hypothetical protein [Ilumatobacteraceae bacterium]